MKGSAITGPVGKEAAELWPVSLLPRISVPHSKPASVFDASPDFHFEFHQMSNQVSQRIASNSGVVM